MASFVSQWLGQIDPQTPSLQISTLPSYIVRPFTNWISPFVQLSDVSGAVYKTCNKSQNLYCCLP